MPETSPVERTPDLSRTRDEPTAPRPGETDVVRRDLAAALLADPAVLRLEPTLSSMVRTWSTAPTPEDLVRVVTTGGTVDVAVHLAVRGEEARLVAHRVREVVRRLLVERGHVPGSVEVSVLTVEPAEVPEVVG